MFEVNSLSLMDYTQGKSVCMEELVSVLRYKLRLSMKSGYFKSDSYARVDVFYEKSLQWNHLASIPSEKMETPCNLMTAKRIENIAETFGKDRARLISLAGKILVPSP